MNSINLQRLWGTPLTLRSARGMWNSALRRFNPKPKPRPFSEFISFTETLKAARAAGLSVGEYIERKHSSGSQTALDQTLDGLAAAGLFNSPIDRICELGPGSGRYLERVVGRCHPGVYEIYETSSEWRKWLVERYGVIARHCDGKTLAETESESVDLIHGHKIFPGLPFLTTASYFREMARVVRSGGWVVFDIMTEACFPPEHLDAWFGEDPWGWAWSPHMVARDYVVGMFAQKGVHLVDSFQVPLFPAVTECMVFRKVPSKSMSR
jgi:hypothetical protein